MGAIPAQLAPYAFKPGQHTVGRVAGNPNKLTSYVRNVLAGAFHKIGGEEAFVQWAQNNPTDFYCRLWIKLLPDSSQLSEDEREKVLDAMLGVQKVLTQEFTGAEAMNAEIKQESTVVQSVDTPPASTVGPSDTISPPRDPNPAP